MSFDFKKYVSSITARHAPLLLLSALLTLLQLSGLAPILRFDRHAILDGQWWRLLTGNLVHVGWMHLGLNVAALILCWWLFGDRLRRVTWAAAVVWCSAAVGVGLLAFSPSIAWYDGFSGTLHGLFAIGALRSKSYEGRWVLLFLVGKIVYQQWSGDTTSAALIGANVVVSAHLYGFIAGLLFAGFMALFEFRRSTCRDNA